MKTTILILAIFATVLSIPCFSQIHIKAIVKTSEVNEEIDLSDAKDIHVSKEVKSLQSLIISCADLPASHKLTVGVGGVVKDYTSPKANTELDFKIDILNKEITIKHIDENSQEITSDQIKFRIIPDQEDKVPGGGGKDPGILQTSIDEYVEKNYSSFQPTPFGFIDPADEERRIHIFFDYFGNSLKSTIPSGISNAQYVVHIIYPFSIAEPNKVSYTIRQKSGTFSNALLFNNSGIRSQIPGQLQAGEKYDGITERKFLLGTSTDDLTFDVVAATKDNQVAKTTLETYTIKMTPVFHGSFDVGLLRTNLSNPTFSLVQDPNGSNLVVKQTDESPKGVVTVMASFYVSPIILLESWLGKKKIPFYKLTGRSFLDDHKIYERFYPTIGVGLSDKVFENIYFGVNWEISRGLSVFGGWHYGKIRTFEMPGYKVNVTPVTQEQFDFYQNTRWKTSTAVGIKLDVMIVRNLFGVTGT